MGSIAAARKDEVLRGRNLALQELATGASLETVLVALTRSVEDAFPEVRCSLLLLDEEGKLHHGTAPRMPEFYTEAIDGVEIGPNVGSCGAAAYTGERVIVGDVMTHPNWESFRELARAAGFRACWSEPVLGSGGEVLGTFAMYYDSPREPDEDELDFMQATAHLAGIAIERKRAERRLVASEELFRQLAENVGGVVWLTNWDAREVLYISPTYETIYGRSCQSLYDDATSWSKAVHPDDRDRVVASFANEAERGRFDEEYRVVRPDGSVRWIHDRAFPIRDANGAVYRVAGISEDVTEKKLFERELWEARDELDERRKAQLESLTSELLLAEERERQRLSQDLHDGLNQTVSLAQMKLARIRDRAKGEEREALDEVADLIGRANRAARSLTFQLSPPVLHDLGFEAAVQWLVEDIEESHGLDIRLEELPAPLPLDEKVSMLLFRAVRELLINIAKHAKANKASVKVFREERMARISVEDDGVAFDTAVVGKRGIGLFGIRERLSHLGGSMSIESEPGKGTAVTLLAPLARQEA